MLYVYCCCKLVSQRSGSGNAKLSQVYDTVVTNSAGNGLGNTFYASSSAVAKRPRDASSLSASTVRNVEQSFVVTYVGYRFITAYNYTLFCCL